MGLPDSSSGQENRFLWNLSTKWIGAIKTSVYIYVSPVVTVVASVVILHEKMTFVSVAGALLILLGLIVLQKKMKKHTTKYKNILATKQKVCCKITDTVHKTTV